MGYIVKRGKAWAAVLYLGREKQDGGWTTERRLWRTVRGSRRDAERLLRMLEDRHERRELSMPRKETVAEYLRRWAREIAPRSAGPTTCESYKLAIEKHWIPRLSAIRLDRLSPAHISSAIGDLLTRGRCHGKQVAGLSSGTVVRDYRVLHKALEDAVDAGDLLANPASRRVKVPKRRRADTTTLTDLQAIRFLDAAGSSRLAALYELALTTGLRQGELLGLRWQDVNLDLSVLAVRQVYSHGAFRAPKTEKSRRRVELDAHTVEVLRRHKAEQDRERGMLGPDYRDQDLVFATWTVVRSTGTASRGTSSAGCSSTLSARRSGSMTCGTVTRRCSSLKGKTQRSCPSGWATAASASRWTFTATPSPVSSARPLRGSPVAFKHCGMHRMHL